MKKINFNKYSYTKINETYVKLINILGLLCSIVMLYGLMLLTIKNIFYIIIFTPPLLIFMFYYFSHYLFNLKFKKFQTHNHHAWIKSIWCQDKFNPPVDVYIPYCGEGVHIVRETAQAAVKIEYENKKIYILDDSGDPEVRKMTEELGVGYISRPDKGYMKKGGNINYAMNHTNGDFIAIFDADFVPDPDFLKDLLPYFMDEKVGIIQTPQFFVEKESGFFDNVLTNGGASLQEDFYKIIQPARNNFNGAICVGTNLLYRRASLDKSGGVANVPWCEDFETGFNITANGYHVLYIPLILAQGRCPDNPQAYFNQHRRWCYSCLRLFFMKKFFKSDLKPIVRLAYISNILYYAKEAASILIILFFSFMMTLERHTIDTRYFDYFIPYFIFLFVVQPLFRNKRLNIGTFITSALQSFTYLYTVLVMLFNRKLDWIPSHKKIKGISPHFVNCIILAVIVIFLEIYNLTNAFLLKNITFRLWSSYPFVVWFFILIVTQLFLMFYIFYDIIKNKFLKTMEVILEKTRGTE